jgi:hypothetical protein
MTGLIKFDRTIESDFNDHLIYEDAYDKVHPTNFTPTAVGGKDVRKFIYLLFKLQADSNVMVGILNSQQ